VPKENKPNTLPVTPALQSKGVVYSICQSSKKEVWLKRQWSLVPVLLKPLAGLVSR